MLIRCFYGGFFYGVCIMADYNEVQIALTYIDANDRDTWLKVGTALKAEFGEQGYELFEEWSRTSPKFNLNAVKSTWKSARVQYGNIGYVFNRAKENGFVRQNIKPMSAAEIEERNRKNRERAAKEEQKQAKKQAAASRRAKWVFEERTQKVNPQHPYLVKKGISDPAVLQHIRQSGNNLIIPLKQGKKVVGIQMIFPNGRKYMPADTPKRGSAMFLGDTHLENLKQGFFVAEGFATAASIVQATGRPCLMTIDAGNMPTVVHSLKNVVQKHHIPVVLCADNDEDHKGEKKAKEAAEILGDTAQVIMPDFTAEEIARFQANDPDKLPSDFNDLQTLRGIDSVTKMLSGSLTAVVNPENKLLINVYGSPATGKSYTAEHLAAALRDAGIECELVTEYATELIHQGRTDELKDQVVVTGEQLRREQAALNHANIVITDSPTALGIIYAPEHQKAALHDIAAQSDKIPHINILLRHDYESLATFSMNGRIHDKKQSLAIQEQLIEMLKGKYPIHHQRAKTLEELINNIGTSQEWQRFAEHHNINLPRFDIAMDGTVMNKDDNLSGSLNVAENDTLVAEKTAENITMNDEMPKPERSAWGDFPPVIRNGNLGELEKEPEYQAAKAGDIVAAGELVNRLIKRETLEQIQAMIGNRKPIIVAVVAEEATGNNAIPFATAKAIGRELDLPVDERNIVQINKVARTHKGIDHRFAFQPVFDGEVQQGREYLIVDDTSTVGGTIASLKGYIENRGGKVVGATVMTAHDTSLELPITQKMLDNIQRKHGNAMNEFWQKEFGYGIDKLTNYEAGHLRKAQNVEQIRDRIATARHNAMGGVLEQTLPKADIQSPSEEKALNPDPEKLRPPQGGFVLPVENRSDENRQPENSNSKENQMATQQDNEWRELLKNNKNLPTETLSEIVEKTNDPDILGTVFFRTFEESNNISQVAFDKWVKTGDPQALSMQEDMKHREYEIWLDEQIDERNWKADEYDKLVKAQENPDKQMLMQMLNNKSVSFRQMAATSDLADDEVLQNAYQDKDESVRLAAVRNPNASSEFLRNAFNDAFPTEKEAILNHPNANEELFKEALVYSSDDSVINTAREHLQNKYGWDDERFAALEQERFNNLSRYEQQRLQEEQSGLKKSELTAAPPLEKQEWQPDTFTPDTWQSETAPMTEQNKHLDGETAQKVDDCLPLFSFRNILLSIVFLIYM